MLIFKKISTNTDIIDYATNINQALFYQKYIYGDPAYAVCMWLLSGYKGAAAVNAAKKEFNTWMSRVRTSVEWFFGIAKRLWKTITWKYGNKVMLSAVAKMVQY